MRTRVAGPLALFAALVMIAQSLPAAAAAAAPGTLAVRHSLQAPARAARPAAPARPSRVARADVPARPPRVVPVAAPGPDVGVADLQALVWSRLARASSTTSAPAPWIAVATSRAETRGWPGAPDVVIMAWSADRRAMDVPRGADALDLAFAELDVRIGPVARVTNTALYVSAELRTARAFAPLAPSSERARPGVEPAGRFDAAGATSPGTPAPRTPAPRTPAPRGQPTTPAPPSGPRRDAYLRTWRAPSAPTTAASGPTSATSAPTAAATASAILATATTTAAAADSTSAPPGQRPRSSDRIDQRDRAA